MNSAYFQEQIRIRQDEITFFRRLLRFLAIGGGVILAFALLAWILVFVKKIDSNLAPSFVSLMGAALSFSSFLPFKEITPRRLAIAKFVQLQYEFERIKDLPERERENRIREINQHLKEYE